MNETNEKEAVYLSTFLTLKKLYLSGQIDKQVFDRLNRKNAECQGCKCIEL